MVNTGIYGGSFNPIHNGHIALARQLLGQGNVEEIWFMVSPQNPLKRHRQMLPDELRLQLVRQALEQEDGLSACDFEFRLPRPSYTWNTLRELSNTYPDRTFTLIIGADNWVNFHHWYKADELLAHYPVMVYPRTGSPVNAETLPKGVTLAQTARFDVSSTEVRRRMEQGESISGLVPGCVEEWARQQSEQRQQHIIQDR
ncbi:MAG: nicotinate (nicotinamide) nucleotide adenylyltransferase [Prevotella sp.]